MKRVLPTWAIWSGIGLILLSLSIPKWLGPEQVGLDHLLLLLERESSGNALMIAAFVLVALNTIITLPYFLGSFIFGDLIGEQLNKPWLKIAIPLVIAPLVNIIIHLAIDSRYQLDSSEILLLFVILAIQKLDKGRLGPAMKSLVLSQFLFGVNWLNLVPFLSILGFGRGAISTKVKQMAVQIGLDEVLTLYALVLCLIFIVNAAILGVFLGVYAEKWMISQELHRAHLQAVESRSGREVLHLVHDLKTPLTTIEGLISLINMRVQDKKIKEYCYNISLSIQAMSEMVSEILYEKRKSWCNLEELFNYVRASRISGTKASLEIELPQDPAVPIWINKIRITRALVNLIDNAFDAVQGKVNGQVALRAQTHENQIWLGVTDNGVGMSAEEKERVWEAGYSTKQHPGVGLSFVRQVAEGHRGSVLIESEPGRGTTVWIQLPKGDYMDENLDY